MTSRQRNSQEDTNYRVLRLLQDNPNLSQRELASALGISLGGLNYCLQALLGKGLIKVQNFQSSKRKLAYAYLLTPSGMAEKAVLTSRFLKRKMVEYESLKPRKQSASAPTEKGAPAAKAKTYVEQEADFKKRQVEAAEREAAQKKKADEVAENKQNCEQVRVQLKVLQAGGRVTQTNAQGEREYMSDAQIGQEIERLNKAEASLCR